MPGPDPNNQMEADEVEVEDRVGISHPFVRCIDHGSLDGLDGEPSISAH